MAPIKKGLVNVFSGENPALCARKGPRGTRLELVPASSQIFVNASHTAYILQSPPPQVSPSTSLLLSLLFLYTTALPPCLPHSIWLNIFILAFFAAGLCCCWAYGALGSLHWTFFFFAPTPALVEYIFWLSSATINLPSLCVHASPFFSGILRAAAYVLGFSRLAVDFPHTLHTVHISCPGIFKRRYHSFIIAIISKVLEFPSWMNLSLTVFPRKVFSDMHLWQSAVPAVRVSRLPRSVIFVVLFLLGIFFRNFPLFLEVSFPRSFQIIIKDMLLEFCVPILFGVRFWDQAYIERLIDWLFDFRRTVMSCGWLIDWFFDTFFDCSIDWLIDRLSEVLVLRSVDWLIDCLLCCLLPGLVVLCWMFMFLACLKNNSVPRLSLCCSPNFFLLQCPVMRWRVGWVISLRKITSNYPYVIFTARFLSVWSFLSSFLGFCRVQLHGIFVQLVLGWRERSSQTRDGAPSVEFARKSQGKWTGGIFSPCLGPCKDWWIIVHKLLPW